LRQARYRLTLEEARERYGEGNCELLEWRREAGLREKPRNRLTSARIHPSGARWRQGPRDAARARQH